MYGIIDCDNCYVSCERLFRPDLENKPVVVLSNNDGCVVARSNEAKKLGIKAGMPYFKLRQLFPNDEITVFSSNYELYGEITARVVDIIKQESPAYFRYSIDECFVYFNHVPTDGLKAWGENLHCKIRKWVGMPVSIGIGPDKTLAKVASHFAKKVPGYRHCCMIDTDEKRVKALKLFSIGEVWGIGGRYSAKLQSLGINTAYDFARMSDYWVRSHFNNVVIYRTWQELNGLDAVPNEEYAKKQTICTSRSFPTLVGDYPTLRTQVSNFASLCAEKLRAQSSVASVVSVFINTNPFREDLMQYWNYQEERLFTPSNASITIVNAAIKALEKVYQPGFMYKKAGVIVLGVRPDNPVQFDFFDVNPTKYEKLRQIDSAIDRINHIYGSETVVLGVQQYTQPNGDGKAGVFSNSIRHDHRSPNPTTRWSDIIKLK